MVRDISYIPNHRDIRNSCNMGMRDLLDMYTQSLRATGPRAEDIHIRQITNAYVTSNMYHFQSMGKLIVPPLKLKTTIKLYKLL